MPESYIMMTDLHKQKIRTIKNNYEIKNNKTKG